MNSSKLYEQYLLALKQRTEFENKIDEYLKKREKGETVLSDDLVQEALEKGYERLKNLKKIEEEFHNEYLKQEQNEETKRSADNSVQHTLGMRPTDINIVDGALSSNANESHLIGESKSLEELEQERQQLLANVKRAVQSGTISLADASRLVNNVNTSYDFYQSKEQTDEMKR